MPVGGMVSPEVQGPPPPEFGGRFKVIKICLAFLICCAIGQLVAGALLGAFPRLVFLVVDIVVGIFLLNYDDDVKPAYSFMMETCFSACADQCRGGMSCLSNFVLINLVSFFMGMIFDAPTAILDIFVVCNGGTHGLSLGHTTRNGVSTEPGALDSISRNTSNIEHPAHEIKSQFDHLTATASVALLIKAICMLLANLAQSVCLFQGLRIVLDFARLRSSQALPTWSDDDPNFASFGPGGLGLRPGQPGRWPGGLMAMGRANGGVSGNAGRADGTASAGPGGDGGNQPSQGNTVGQTSQYQPFSGQGHRLGSD